MAAADDEGAGLAVGHGAGKLVAQVQSLKALSSGLGPDRVARVVPSTHPTVHHYEVLAASTQGP
jgi:hypothetical protein